MPIKGQITRSDYLEWDTYLSLLLKLKRDGNFKFALLIGSGCYLGLRIKDLLQLRWKDVLEQDDLVLIESKTKKEEC